MNVKKKIRGLTGRRVRFVAQKDWEIPRKRSFIIIISATDIQIMRRQRRAKPQDLRMRRPAPW
jgi:hypothetical protein